MPDEEPQPAAAPEAPPPSPSATAQAIAGLHHWAATFCHDNSISRDTHALNVINAAVATIASALTQVQE